MGDEKIHVWVTKYALTRGILEQDVEPSSADPTAMVCMIGHQSTHYFRKEWHLTLEEAVKEAERMRAAKIVAIKKNLAKMERMTF
jgi:hypothetical protein